MARFSARYCRARARLRAHVRGRNMKRRGRLPAPQTYAACSGPADDEPGAAASTLSLRKAFAPTRLSAPARAQSRDSQMQVGHLKSWWAPVRRPRAVRNLAAMGAPSQEPSRPCSPGSPAGGHRGPGTNRRANATGEAPASTRIRTGDVLAEPVGFSPGRVQDLLHAVSDRDYADQVFVFDHREVAAP